MKDEIIMNEKKEFLDKKSTHYFMCHMIQKEFDKIIENAQIKPLKLNKINYGKR
jgi:hypothetical protein